MVAGPGKAPSTGVFSVYAFGVLRDLLLAIVVAALVWFILDRAFPGEARR